MRRHLVWALVVLCYLYPFPYFPKLNNPNENVRIWQTRAIAQYHELDVKQVSSDWGPVNDCALAGDRVVSSKAPGVSLLGVPVYGAQLLVHHLLGLAPPSQASVTRVLRVVVVALPMAAFLLLFARWVERTTRSARARDMLVLGLGLGTPMYPYGLIFAGHVHGAALGFAAFVLLATAPPRAGPRRLLFTAGLAAGFAVVFEYQLAILLVVLALWALVQHRRPASWFLLGALPAIALLGAYHTILFGQPWAFPYGHLANPGYAEHDHGAGFFGLTLPSPAAVSSLLFSLQRGLFVFSPFLIVGIWGGLLSVMRGQRSVWGTGLAAVVAMFLFQAGMSNWTAGWSVGPRYIVVVAPLLAAAAAGCWRWVPEEVLMAVLGGLLIASIFMCGLSGAMFPHYPDTTSNPVFNLTLPLLRTGHAPYNLGRSLGLRGGWSMAPLALIAACALGVAMGPPRRSSDRGRRRWLGAIAIAGALGGGYLFVQNLAARANPADAEALALVESLWEPVP